MYFRAICSLRIGQFICLFVPNLLLFKHCYCSPNEITYTIYFNRTWNIFTLTHLIDSYMHVFTGEKKYIDLLPANSMRCGDIGLLNFRTESHIQYNTFKRCRLISVFISITQQPLTNILYWHKVTKVILVLLSCENNGLIVQEQLSCQSTAYKNHIQE